MTDVSLFQRNGSPVSEAVAVRHDEKGKPYFLVERKCSRCGGAGGSDRWAYTGWTCFDCSGSGKHKDGAMQRVPLYTADRLAKLNAAETKRRAARQAKFDAAQAARQAEAEARRAAFEAEHADLLAWLRGAVAGEEVRQDVEAGSAEGFLPDMLRRAERDAEWSEGQLEGIRKTKTAREAAEAKRAASRHVGARGDRITAEVEVERVHEFQRACFGASWKSETVAIVTMRDADGNALVAKGTNFRPEKGDRLTIKATVKDHDEYRGEQQTILTRVVDVAKDAERKARNKEWKAREAAQRLARAVEDEMSGGFYFHEPLSGSYEPGTTVITREGVYSAMIYPAEGGWMVYRRADCDWNPGSGEIIPHDDADPLAVGETYSEVVEQALSLLRPDAPAAQAVEQMQAGC